MKKIIYSLVAMLFMGSVFTSCIPQTEPEGVRDMREAHAYYLRQLADLVKANEAVAAAQAEFERARAAVKLSVARQNNAQAEAQELLNALQAAQNENDIAALKEQRELDRLAYEKDLLDAQKALEQAKKAFDDAMAALEIEKLTLSQDELDAIAVIKAQYDYWTDQYVAILAEYYGDAYDEYWDLYDALWDGIIDEAEFAYMERFMTKQIEVWELEKAYAEQEADFWEGLLDDMNIDFLAEAKAYKDSAEAMSPLFAELLRDSVLFVQEYEFARDEAIREADSVYINAIKDPQAKYEADIDALKKANKDWDKMIESEPADPAEGDPKTDIFKAKGGKFEFKATGKKAYKLPKDASGMIDLYKTQAGLNGFSKNVKFVDNTLEITISEADSASYAKAVDTIWNGNQATEELLKAKTGLWSVYEDFSRSLLYDIDASGIEADSLLLKAYVAKVRKDYDKILGILKSAKKGQGEALVDAWAKKVKAAKDDIDKLAKKVDEFEDFDKKAENNIYTVKDAVNGYDGAAPRVIYKYANKGARKISRDESDKNHFDLTAADPKWFTTDPTNPMSIVLASADSAEFINAIKDYFDAVASINSKAVPYLKFITADNVGNFKVDSVAANKIDLAGLKMQKSNTYLEGRGINKVALYDNKAINDITVPPTDAANYVDALTNVINLYNHYVHGEAFILPFYTAADEAYSASTSGVEAYAKYVDDFKKDNTGKTLDKYHKKFDSYTDKDFAKYTAMSDEGKAVADWMAACQTYFGVEGFAGIAEQIFFDYDTFTDPTLVAVFKGVPTYGYTKDKDGNITGIAGPIKAELATPKSYQYQFVENRIKENLEAVAAGNGAYTDPDMLSSLVFELLKAEYAYNLSINSKSISQTWEALGEVLKKAKADMDAVIGDTQKSQAKNKALADKANAILKAYRDAIKGAQEAKEAAVKEANDTYAEAYEEIMVPILHAYSDLRAKYDYYMGISDALYAAYATIWAGDKADPTREDIEELLLEKLDKALAKAAKLAVNIEDAKLRMAQIKADFEAGGEWEGCIFDDERLDLYAEMMDYFYELYLETVLDEEADVVFWYEYWKAAYEAAIEYVMNKGE